MSFDAHRLGVASCSPPRTPSRPTAAPIFSAADTSLSTSPPTQRMRRDGCITTGNRGNNNDGIGRCGGSAPAAPALAASPRVNGTATLPVGGAAGVHSRAHSKSVTQRRTSIPSPSTGRSGVGQPQPQPQPQQQSQQRGRRRENESSRGPVLGERSAQHTRARKVNSGAASARRAPISSPPRSLANACNSCTLPPMLGQLARTPPPSNLHEAAPSPAAVMGSFSYSVPLLAKFTPPTHPPAYSPVESFSPPSPHIAAHPAPHEGGSHRIFSDLSSSTLTDSAITPRCGGFSPTGSISDDLTTFSQLHCATTSTASKASAKVKRQAITSSPPPQSQSRSVNVSSSSIHSTAAINGAASNGCLHAAASASSYFTPAAWSSAPAVPANKSAALSTSPLPFNPLSIATVNAAAATAATAATATTSSPTLPSQSSMNERSSFCTAEPRFPSASASSAPSVHKAVIATQRVLTGSSSTSFQSSPDRSPIGLGSGAGTAPSTAARPPPARDAASLLNAPALQPPLPASSLQQQPPHTHTQRSSLPYPALTSTRGPHTPVTVSPNPMRPPRTNGSTPRRTSVSADRRPLVGAAATSTATSNGTAGTASTAASAAVRSVSKSPTGTLSTEAAKKAMRERRRRELYAWNELLRKKNEAGVQDAV